MNFLYMPNQNDWNFDHNPLMTLKYYFKKLDKNYIIFEIFKNSYFCILIKRNDNNKLEYYKINSSYDDIENSFFEKREDGNLLLDFETIQSNLIENIEELDLNKFKALLYGKSKREKTIIWLNDNSTQKTFSKIYKYLLNTKLISNEKVKESLLIADKKHEEIREFTTSDNQKIEDIKRHQNYIGKLKSIKKDFFEFKDKVEEYYIKNENLNSFYLSFNTLYNEEFNRVIQEKNTLILAVENTQSEQIKPLEKEKSDLDIKFGTCLANIQSVIKNHTNKEQEILKIEKYDSIELLQASLQNIETEKKNLEYDLSQIERENYTQEKIQGLISKQKTDIDQLEAQINNFENLLIHHIAEDEKIKKVINNVVSDKILNLDKEKIISIIRSVDENILNIFDGKIDISNIKERDFITIDSLNTQLQKTKKELEKYTSIHTNIQNFNDKQNILKQLEKDIKTINSQIEEIEKLPKLKEELLKFENEKKKLEDEKQDIEKEKEKLKKQIEEIKASIEEKNKTIKNYEERLKTLEIYYKGFEDELQNLQLNFKDEKPDKSIDDLVTNIKTLKTTLYTLKSKKDSEFFKLKNILQKEHSYEKEFIKEIEEELSSIKDRQNSIDTLIDSITNDISKPTSDFLKHLEQFEGYISSINTKFKKYKISDLESIEIKLHPNKILINELKLISNIDKNTLFQDDYNQKIEILKEYIGKSKKFHLSDLFDINFIINGNVANLNKQTESNGTDRILKVTLFILIMRDLIVQDSDNKLVIYIDELGEVDDDNIYELIKRCKENNFIPIFAAPDKKPHIDKYYDLIEDSSTKKITVDDSRAIYVKDRV
ncbi:hypothetical protein [Arcobacter sp. CECT 8983]|uniref:hypothetical protein n=1 Tax=Arcobacter sp. CECT 8983 TaxID=2044508 RepID=UPI00100B0B77|nr:hypothetical protein [Arcobacter sp. CECT 8983]